MKSNINVILGKSGPGAVAFRRKVYEKGGPNGGDGSNGGGVYVIADKSLRNLGIRLVNLKWRSIRKRGVTIVMENLVRICCRNFTFGYGYFY